MATTSDLEAAYRATTYRVFLPGVSFRMENGKAVPNLHNIRKLAAVTTYIRNAWGNAAPAVSASDAKKVRERVANRAE